MDSSDSQPASEPQPSAPQPSAPAKSGKCCGKGFWTGMLVMLILVIVVPLLIAASGIISVSTQGSWGPLDPILDMASSRSVSFHAKNETNPYANDPAAIKVGMHHYKEMCVVCHGAPGLKRSEIAEGLNPHAPHLGHKGSQDMSDGELFWIIAHGVRSTGMPGFEKADDVATRWKIVAFVRHLPKLTDAEREFLKSGDEDEDHTAPAKAGAKEDGADHD